MTKSQLKAFPDPHHDTFSKRIFGFWIYLMSDCLLFASLFATYAVLRDKTFGGPSTHDLFNLKTALIETLILLFSSVTCGFAVLSALKDKKSSFFSWLVLTFILGLSFVIIELSEFREFVEKGAGPDRSAFLSSFFTLVGTHGFHVSTGLLWLIVLIPQVIYKGFTVHTFRRIVCFNMFWHFLDLVWVFIFTFVYLMGVV